MTAAPVLLLSCLFGIFAKAPAHSKTMDEAIAAANQYAEEDVQKSVDQATKRLREIEEATLALDSDREQDWDDLKTKHKLKWVKFDSERAEDEMKIAEKCLDDQDKCGDEKVKLEQKQVDEFEEIVTRNVMEKDKFELDYFKKSSELNDEAADCEAELEADLSKIYQRLEKKIEDIIERFDRESLKMVEEELRASAKLHKELKEKVRRVTQELEEPCCFKLVGVERLMNSEEIEIFEYEVARALSWLMQHEGIDLDILDVYDTVNTDLELLDTRRRRRLGTHKNKWVESGRTKRTSRTMSRVVFNIDATCSTCKNCNCLEESYIARRTLSKEYSTFDRRLPGRYKDMFVKRLSITLRDVFQNLETVEQVRCE